MPRHIHTNQVDYSRTIVSQADGGTGHRTAQEAAIALGLVTQATIDGDSSYFKLDSAGQIKINNLPKEIQTICNTVAGISSMAVNSTANFTIVDYDAYTDYTVVAVAGSVSRTGNTVTYNSPSSGGTHGFTINGKLYPIVVTGVTVAKATIATPVNNATNQGPSLNVTTNAFSVSGGSDTYNLTELEIATDIGFLNKVVTLSQNGTSFNTMLPTPNQDYYIRARHKGTTYGYGTWSDITHITAKTSFMAVSEVAKLIGSGNQDSQFGHAVALSADGNILVVGAFAEQNYQGRVYVYENVSGSWVQRQVLSTEVVDNNNFGYNVAVNGNGTTIAVGVPNGDTSVSINTGCVYVYEKNGVTWNNTAKLWGTDVSVNCRFGYGLALSYDGMRLVICASHLQVSNGKLYVYDKMNSVWTNTHSMIPGPGDPYVSGFFSGKLALSKDGSKLAVGDHSYNNATGRVYLFDANNNWSQIKTFNIPVPVIGKQFGYSLAFSSNADTLAISAYSEDINFVAQGSVYVFTTVNPSDWAIWSEPVQLYENELNQNSYYGAAIALSGDGTVMAIGSGHADFNANDAGCVYLYNKNAQGQWVKKTRLQASDVKANAYFGTAIAMSEASDTLVIGSLGANEMGQVQAGAAYVFK